MANGLPAVGASLLIGASSANPLPAPASDSFTGVPLLNSLTPPAAKRKLQTYATLDSPAPRAYGGVIDAAKASFEILVDFTDTIHRRIIADSENASNVKRNYRIVYPNAAAEQLDFVGFVSDYTEEAMNADGIVKAKVEVSVDGAWTRTS